MGRASFPPSFLPSNLPTCPPHCHGNKGGGSQITGSGFLPGAGPRGCPLQTHAPFTLPLRVGRQGCFSLLVYHLWSLPFPGSACLSPSPLVLESSHPSQDSRDRECVSPSPLQSALLLKPRNPVGGRSQKVLTSQHPESQGGGLSRDAPRHVPHTQWEPTEAAHHEGVGAPRSSPRASCAPSLLGLCGAS